MQVRLWGGVVACAVLAVASGVASWRRDRRVNLDRVSAVDWTTVQFAALFGGVMLAALAISG
ncbi:hypothetical protein [uncultured Sphingomonas sp.]|uniref:hypothetical protein n=1 Tax=uncultured Sphingomonas sp. TaxID=158754 RepID=UPI0025D31960|nr:hypothetical protein [uncultured Sphingomonas sp.]